MYCPFLLLFAILTSCKETLLTGLNNFLSKRSEPEYVIPQPNTCGCQSETGEGLLSGLRSLAGVEG